MKRLFILILLSLLILLAGTAAAESEAPRTFTVDEQAYDVYLDVSYVMDNSVKYLEELKRLWEIALQAESVEYVNTLNHMACISEDNLIALTTLYYTKYGYSDTEYKQHMFSRPVVQFKEKTDLIWYYLALDIEAKYLVSMDSLSPYLEHAMAGIRSIMATNRDYPFLKDLQNYYKEAALILDYSSDFNDNYTKLSEKLDSYQTSKDSWGIDFEFIFNPDDFGYVKEIRASEARKKNQEIYDRALTLENNGSYQEAIDLYWQCSSFSDAHNRIRICQNKIASEHMEQTYQTGLSLMESEQYFDALEIFCGIPDYKDSAKLAKTCATLHCTKTEDLYAAGNPYEALRMYVYHNQLEWSPSFQQNLSAYMKNKLSGGSDYTVGVKPDGSVFFKGNNWKGCCDVESWQNIVAIAAANHTTVGLQANGKVIAIGSNDQKQCSTGKWADIIAIDMGLQHTVGLKSDGTVVATGYNDYGGCDVQDWNDIVAVSAGSSHSIGLKSDGSVVAAGVNGAGQCSVETWNNIVAIEAGSGFTVGLLNDGTVVATGRNQEGQCEVNDWKNIISIAVSGYCTIGLTDDGKIVVAGDSSKLPNIDTWNNIVALATGTGHVIGLKTDGSLIATGQNNWSQCELHQFNLFD